MNKTEFRMLIYQGYKFAMETIGQDLHLPVEFPGQRGNDLLRSVLEKDAPCMVCRFGGTEIRTIRAYLNQIELSAGKKWLHRLKGEAIGIPEKFKTMMMNYSGFFPREDALFDRFCELMIQDMAEVDLLAAWRPEEFRMKRYMPEIRTIDLDTLEPCRFLRPWTGALAGKKVLVVHPFVTSIRAQYARKELLFRNAEVLPQFDLKVVAAVQSIAGCPVAFGDWFEALDSMKRQIDGEEFEVALIGAGAYGFPLAAHVKRMGRKAVHVGGALQLLFGIKGNRWRNQKFYRDEIFNEFWVNPAREETPAKAGIVENATYW